MERVRGLVKCLRGSEGGGHSGGFEFEFFSVSDRGWFVGSST